MLQYVEAILKTKLSTALKNKHVRKNVHLACSSLHIGDKFNNVDLFNSEVSSFLLLFVW